MPETLKNNAEVDFHRRRNAFVIFDNGILMAQDGFAGSHADLLQQVGFSEDQVHDIIKRCARGYALEGNVYLYQGENFSCLSEHNEKTVAQFLSVFQKNGWLSKTGKIYNGMSVGQIGTNWMPIKEF